MTRQRDVIADQDEQRSWPACQGQHSYVDNNRKVRWSSRLAECADYKNLSNMKQSEMVAAVKGCKGCTSWRHKSILGGRR